MRSQLATDLNMVAEIAGNTVWPRDIAFFGRYSIPSYLAVFGTLQNAFVEADMDGKHLPRVVASWQDAWEPIFEDSSKFGFGLGIISQRPSKLDQDVLAQCGTQITMQITNPSDQDAIRNSVEAAGEDVFRELLGLTPGQAVVSGDPMNTPALIQVRNRITEHGADSRDVVDEWTTAYDQRLREPTRSEPAGFGGGESTGVQDLD